MKLILFVIAATICGMCAATVTAASDGESSVVRVDLSAPVIEIN